MTAALILTRFQPGERSILGSSDNRFNGFCCRLPEKPLKRLLEILKTAVFTRLKPGENERGQIQTHLPRWLLLLQKSSEHKTAG